MPILRIGFEISALGRLFKCWLTFPKAPGKLKIPSLQPRIYTYMCVYKLENTWDLLWGLKWLNDPYVGASSR